ncbi:MAG: hypothetical protein QM650_11525 [Microlunatus sp.]
MTDPIGTLWLSAAYSHLFRGVRVTVEELDPTEPLGAARARLAFSDGIEVDAELLESDTAGNLALAVPAYETATGHPVAAAVWPVVEIGTARSGSGENAERLCLKLGQRVV